MASPTQVCLVSPAALSRLASCAAGLVLFSLLGACRTAPVRHEACADGTFLYTERTLGRGGAIVESPVFACGRPAAHQVAADTLATGGATRAPGAE